MKMEDIDETPQKVVQQTRKVVGEKTKDNYFVINGLPSKMKFYPEGTVIEARPLKVLDVKLLSSLDESNFNNIVNKVLERTIRGIDVDSILVADKYFIIFWLRANTYKDSSYTMKFHCPKCKKASEYNFGLDCLHVNELDDDFDFTAEFELPTAKNRLLFKLPSIEDEMKLESFTRSTSTVREYDKEVLAVANVITSIDGEKYSLLQKYEFLTELFPGDYGMVEAYIETFDIGIDTEMNVKCNQCGGSSPLGITFQKEFFFPKFDLKRPS